MDTVGLLESGSVSLCGVAVILWMSIGTFSRSAAGELLAQRAIAMICLVSAVLLFVLHYMGGELWGSRNMARPMAVIAVIVAISAVMNIKGKDVQGETNPHKIARMRSEEEGLFSGQFIVDETAHVGRQFSVRKYDIIDFFKFHQRVINLHRSHRSSAATCTATL